MERHLIDFEGKLIYVWAKRDGKNTWLHYEGRTVLVPDKKSSVAGDRAQALDDTGEIFAPMPGKILKVNCSVGSQVKVGEVLIVMEAMKMEYSLTAGRNGKILELNCKPGDQVQKGTKLVGVGE